MTTYENLLNAAQAARAATRKKLSDLQLDAANLRIELENRLQAPKGYVSLSQPNAKGTDQTLPPEALALTGERSMAFSVHLRLQGSASVVATLVVPVCITRTDLSLEMTVDNGPPNVVSSTSSAEAIDLVTAKLIEKANELGD